MTEYEAFVMYIPLIAEIVTELRHSDMSFEEYQQWRNETLPVVKYYRNGLADKILKTIDLYVWGCVTDTIEVNGAEVRLYLVPIDCEGGNAV